MTALAPTDSRLATFKRDLAEQYKGFSSLLPEGYPVERFARMCVNAVQGLPDLLDPSARPSLWLALANCAALNIEPNSLMHEAVIIPRKKRRKGASGQWETTIEASLQLEYRAYVRLCYNAGIPLQAGTIYEGDEVSFAYGDDAHFRLVPRSPWKRGAAEVLGYYAYARVDGRPVFVVWSKAEVEAHRDRYSDAYQWAEHGDPNKGGGKKDSAWHTSPDRMGEKTVLIQLATRWLPKEVQRLANVDIALEEGRAVRAIASGEVEILPAGEATTEDEPVEKVVQEVERAAPAPASAPEPELDEAQERLMRKRAELANRPPQAAQRPASAPPTIEQQGEPEAGPQPGDAYRQGYDRKTNTIEVRGSKEPVHITAEPLRTNQGKGAAPMHCGWCGGEILVGDNYYDGRRGVKAHPGCVEEQPPEEDEAPELPADEVDELLFGDEPEEEPPPVPAGAGPSPEARQAVLPTASDPGTLTGKQIQALLATADAGVGREAFLDAAAKAIPGLESLDEAHANAFQMLMALAMGD